jgi:polar amino acid transport system substrate-binding protein
MIVMAGVLGLSAQEQAQLARQRHGAEKKGANPMRKIAFMHAPQALRFLIACAVAFALSSLPSHAQTPSAMAKTELAPNGKLRVAFPVNAVTAPKNPNGELGGLTADVGRELANRLGVPYEPVEFASPGKFIELAGGDVWDIAVLSPDPARAKVADWSAPVFELDFIYLVPPGSTLTAPADVDRPGVKIGAVRGDAQELAVSRTVKNAEVVRLDGWPATIAALRDGTVHAVAGNRVTTPDNAKALPGSRILDERFGKQAVVIFVPKGKTAALAYVEKFAKEAIASGLVQNIIDRSGRPGMKVAQP